LKLYLANGVTTIRCFGPLGKSGQYGLTWRKQIDAGRIVGPNILTCGPQVRGHFKKEPEYIVISQKYQQFDFLKIYSYEAIAAGTIVASKVVARMKGQDEFGVILPGKRADLILLKQNPLKDVSNTRKISGVMAAGRWYDEEALAGFLEKH
jgi:hypothetical protein